MMKAVCAQFSVMFKDERVADVYADGYKNTYITRYTDVSYKQPFGCQKNDFLSVYDFLKSRCYEDGRADLKKILKAARLNENDPWQWVKITHGVTYDDFWWIKFPGEILSWEEVKIRE